MNKNERWKIFCNPNNLNFKLKKLNTQETSIVSCNEISKTYTTSWILCTSPMRKDYPGFCNIYIYILGININDSRLTPTTKQTVPRQIACYVISRAIY